MEKTLTKYTYNREYVKSVLDVPIYEETATLKSMFGGLRLSQKILGTTFSGSPTRTTLGNTLRVFCYWSYICKCAGLSYVTRHTDRNKDVHIYVSGDDVVLWCNERHVKKLEKTIFQLMSKTKD